MFVSKKKYDNLLFKYNAVSKLYNNLLATLEQDKKPKKTTAKKPVAKKKAATK